MMAGDVRTKRGPWWRLLVVGLALYVIGVLLLMLTGNPNLFPTVAMLGNFVVPAAYVSFFYERRHLSVITMSTTLLSFLYGGLLGVFAASILEPLLIHGMSVPNAFLVGVIEEFVKILGVCIIARRRRHDSELDGLILGAAAGMGFAALESMGYAFTAFLKSGGSLSASVAITLLRGLFSPVGHGTWTALLVSVMFREGTAQRFRINGKVLLAYLTVVILHGLWDGLPIVISAITTQGLDVTIAQALVGAAGVFLLARRWREAVRAQTPPAAAPASPEAAAAS
jgi:RsiW-degrading membrane proteinase PrsW (M82 family)